MMMTAQIAIINDITHTNPQSDSDGERSLWSPLTLNPSIPTVLTPMCPSSTFSFLLYAPSTDDLPASSTAMTTPPTSILTPMCLLSRLFFLKKTSTIWMLCRTGSCSSWVPLWPNFWWVFITIATSYNLPSSFNPPSPVLKSAPANHINNPFLASMSMSCLHPAIENLFPQDHLQDLATTSVTMNDQLPLPDSAHPHLPSHSLIDLYPHHQQQALPHLWWRTTISKC